MTNLIIPPEEIWKDIPGQIGFYQASNLGRIRSLDRYVNCGWHHKFKRKWAGRILKPFYNRHGYLLIDLQNKTYSVHRIIIKTFVGDGPKGFACMHLNDKKDDNRLVNLKWGSYSENTISAIKNRLYTHGRTGKHGKHNPQSKPVIQLTLNGEFVGKHESCVNAAKAVGISQSEIGHVCNGKRKKAGGYRWQFC